MGEKTEKATPKRRRDTREKEGNVLQSKEIMVAVSVLGMFWVMSILGRFMYATMLSIIKRFIVQMGEDTEFSESFVIECGIQIGITFFLTVGPILLASIVFSILPVMVQTQGLINFKALAPKFSKINPFSGIKRLFSIQSAVGILKSIVEIAAICGIVYWRIRDILPDISRLSDIDIRGGVVFTASTVINIGFTISMFLAFVAAADYVFQWWQYEKKLMMSKQEVKDEYKNIEGDPAIKSKIKQKQREMSQKRMMQEVPNSDVVIRNPTHYAVALRYSPEEPSPMVIAKGKDHLALKIIEIADEHRVPVKEDRPLAKALYETVEVGKYVPVELYMVIAEIIAEFYVLDEKGLKLKDSMT